MTRKTITITKPNDEWINAQLAKEEFASNSELINDLIRKARLEEEKSNYVRIRLEQAEISGMSNLSPEDIRLKVRKELGADV
jgi:antitoxin ParD1/3/4